MKFMTLTKIEWRKKWEGDAANLHNVEGYCRREPVTLDLEKVDFLYRTRRQVAFEDGSERPAIKFAIESTTVWLSNGRFQLEVEETPEDITRLL
jgi:hypothetical protein